jgi:hypothetical protein
MAVSHGKSPGLTASTRHWLPFSGHGVSEFAGDGGGWITAWCFLDRESGVLASYALEAALSSYRFDYDVNRPIARQIAAGRRPQGNLHIPRFICARDRHRMAETKRKRGSVSVSA